MPKFSDATALLNGTKTMVLRMKPKAGILNLDIVKITIRGSNLDE